MLLVSPPTKVTVHWLSVTTTPERGALPRFSTSMVKVTVPPATTTAGFAVLVMRLEKYHPIIRASVLNGVLA